MVDIQALSEPFLNMPPPPRDLPVSLMKPFSNEKYLGQLLSSATLSDGWIKGILLY
jgi:hypothetical protein